MNAELARAFLLRLPHVEETMQWGANLVYWVGDKAIGGKMFALVNLDEEKLGKPAPVLSFYAGPERCAELLEDDAYMPAPYLARAYWIALRQWPKANRTQLETLLRQAHADVLKRLSKRVQHVLALPKAARKTLIAERRVELAAAQKSARFLAPRHVHPESKAPSKRGPKL